MPLASRSLTTDDLSEFRMQSGEQSKNYTGFSAVKEVLSILYAVEHRIILIQGKMQIWVNLHRPQKTVQSRLKIFKIACIKSHGTLTMEKQTFSKVIDLSFIKMMMIIIIITFYFSVELATNLFKKKIPMDV